MKNLFRGRFNRGEAVKFHTSYKYLLLSHSSKHFQELGRMVARIKDLAPGEFRERYGRIFMEGLSVKSTIKKNTNALQHIMGYLKTRLDPSAKRDILNVIENYRKGYVPHDVEYIGGQAYLNPQPEKLMLRNHV